MVQSITTCQAKPKRDLVALWLCYLCRYTYLLIHLSLSPASSVPSYLALSRPSLPTLTTILPPFCKPPRRARQLSKTPPCPCIYTFSVKLVLYARALVHMQVSQNLLGLTSAGTHFCGTPPIYDTMRPACRKSSSRCALGWLLRLEYSRASLLYTTMHASC
jgi:hypothetical protein